MRILVKKLASTLKRGEEGSLPTAVTLALPLFLVAAIALVFGPESVLSPGDALGPEEAAAETELTEALVNFETPHVHPIDLTPDGDTLLAVNTPAARLEVFDVSSGTPVQTASIPVGIDPVSVRARSNTEAWVVNHISDSVSVIDLTRNAVVDTKFTDNEPADVVFAGSPQRAFVTASESNKVNIFNPDSDGDDPISTVSIDGEDPRALAVSPDGAFVYAAIFESGNRTTAVSGGGSVNGDDVVSRPEGPYGGQNPPPNSGNSFSPPIAASAGTPSRTAMIVRENNAGRWIDDNNGDWSIFVDGSLASLTNRVQGWELLDHDVAVINANNFSVSYQDHLMNMNMAIGVNPANGRITTVGTDAINEVRFEPNLNGRFITVNIADFARGGSANINDLNPHLDYSTATVSADVREQSVGDPRGIAWHSSGNRAYITGMGSNNVIVSDASGNRIGRFDVGEGPTGIVLDDASNRGYVMNKFSGSISVINTSNNTEVAEVAFFDPTPAVIKQGRPMLYDTHLTSGTGHISCASCHVDARTDRLAWDLGDPQGNADQVPEVRNSNPATLTGNTVEVSSMKGVMLTQTLQDIIDFEVMHWRGDRANLSEFNGTFVNLMGRPNQISASQMQQFEDFLATIHLPPNPFRRIDDTRPNSVTMQNGETVSTSNFQALRGDNSRGNACMQCHYNGNERNLGSNRELSQAFVAPSWSPWYDRLGYWPGSQSGSTTGFGFFHDGADDIGGAARTNTAENQDDMLAEILTLEGPTGPLTGGEERQDSHAGLGQQITIEGSADSAEQARLNQLINIVNNSPFVSMTASLNDGGVNRGFRFDGGSSWTGDRSGETATTNGLLSEAASGDAVTFTVVTAGSETRLGIDIDNDGVRNGDESQPLELAGIADQTSTQGDAVTLNTSVSGGSGTRSFSASGLPTGVSINSSTGVISGTATAAGTFNATVTVSDATGSDSESFTWTVQSSGGGGGGTGQCAGLTQEAEDAALSGAMVVGSDGSASGGQYVHVPAGTGQAWTFGSANQAAFCFDVAQAGTYRIDAAVLGPDSLSDSFFVTVDGQPTDGFLWDVGVTTGFETSSVSDRDGADPVLVNLSAGEHDIMFFQREDGTLLDQVSLVRIGDGGGGGGTGQCAGLTQEAEDAALSGAMGVGSDGSASGGQYVHVPDGTGQAWSFGSANRAVFCFDVAEAGTYRLDALVEGLDSLSDSFFVTVDGFPADGYLWDLSVTNGFETVSLSDRDGDDPVFVDLSAGEHEIIFYQREDGARLDQVTLVRIGGGGGGGGTCAGLTQEAEDAALSGAMTVVSDGSTSGGQYINVPEGTGQSWSFGSSSRAVFCFNVAEAGTYRIDAQVSGLDSLSDSFFVTMDGEPVEGWLWDLGETTGFETVAVSDRTGDDPVLVDLTAGQHELIIFHREDGSRLDSVSLVRTDGDGGGGTGGGGGGTAVTTEAITSMTGFGTGTGDFFLGWRFTVSESVEVVELGAHDADRNGTLGNVGGTSVGLYNMGTGQLLASVEIPAGTAAENGFVYAALAAPVTLQPGVTYAVASEQSGEPYAFNGTAAFDPRVSYVGDAWKSGSALGLPDQTAPGNEPSWIGGTFRLR